MATIHKSYVTSAADKERHEYVVEMLNFCRSILGQPIYNTTSGKSGIITGTDLESGRVILLSRWEN